MIINCQKTTVTQGATAILPHSQYFVINLCSTPYDWAFFWIVMVSSSAITLVILHIIHVNFGKSNYPHLYQN